MNLVLIPYHSVILGGISVTGTADNTVYIPKLNVSSTSGFPTYKLGIDYDNNVVAYTGDALNDIIIKESVGIQSTVRTDLSNTASGYQSSVLGGGLNTATGDYSTIGGGSQNLALGSGSKVGGGQQNTSPQSSFIGGGGGNFAGEFGSISSILVSPFVALPPACSIKKASALHSYVSRSFPCTCCVVAG
jgi:hypothetical protein